jgi:hypothetical protein
MRIEELRKFVESGFNIRTYSNEFYAQSENNCAMVRITPGTTEPHVNRLNVQILLRNESAAQAEEKAWKIYKALRTKSRFFVGDAFVILCIANQPLYIGKDENQRTQYSINCSLITDGE